MKLSCYRRPLVVHFKRPASWRGTPHLYHWDTSPAEPEAASWPGSPMKEEGNDWFMHKFRTAQEAKIVFNDGEHNQTADLQRGVDGYYINAQWYGLNPRYMNAVLVLAVFLSVIYYITIRLLTPFPGTAARPLATEPIQTQDAATNLWGARGELTRAFWHIVWSNPADATWTLIFFVFTLILALKTIREMRRTNAQRTRSSFITSIAFLIPVSVCFFYIFSFPTIRPKPDFNASIVTAAAAPVSEPTLTLISAEHHQALEEIKLRIEHDDDWFHIKFLLIGGLFTLFGSLVVVERIEIGRHPKPMGNNERSQLGFEELIGSPVASTIFAIVLVIAITIDLHVRTSYMVVHQLANWILTHVDHILNCTKSSFSSYCEKSPYMPWEQYLRIADGNVKGMHEDFFWNLFYTPHIHFTTWLIYVFYLSTLFWLFSHGEYSSPPKASGNELRLGSLVTTVVLFAIVQVTLGVFAFIGHTAPGAFYEKLLIPNVELWISGDKAGYPFLVVWLMMTGLVTLRLFTIMPIRDRLCARERIYEDLAGTVRSQPTKHARLIRVGLYITIIATYVLIIVALSAAVLANLYTHTEREALGHLIVPKGVFEDGQKRATNSESTST